MNPYIERLKTYFAEHPPNYENSDVSSMLEFLWVTYTEYNPIDSEKIKALYHALGDVFIDLPFERVDQLFNITGELCVAYEKEAFLSGLLTGARLMTELSLVL